MVVQDNMYPEFPKLECSACGERFEVTRKWVAVRGLGQQIIIDWPSSELLMREHHRMHSTELIEGIESYLASQGSRG